MAQGNVQGMQLRFPHDVPGQDMQIQYMVGERVSSEIQYIARDSKHEFVDIERRYFSTMT